VADSSLQHAAKFAITRLNDALDAANNEPTEHDACRDLHRACAWAIATVGAVGMDRPIADWTWRSHNRPKAAHSYEFALLMPEPFVDELRRFILTYAKHDRDCPGLDAAESSSETLVPA